MTKCITRAAAGAAYQAAAQAYFDAWVELAAHDHATNGGGNGRGFAAQPEIAPHAEFLRDLPGNQIALMHQRHAEIAASK